MAVNPIEEAFSKLKAMLRKIGERTVNGLGGPIGKLVDIYQPDECAKQGPDLDSAFADMIQHHRQAP